MNLSLLWKILLSTALIITVVLGATAWFVENQTVTVLTYDLQGAIRSGFESYEALWKERADSLRSIGTVLSAMSDVRAAFQTNDRATIRDTAGEIWSRISQSSAIFLVTDPQGKVIASLGGLPIEGAELQAVRSASQRFPAQAEGFSVQNGELYELVITPVYVQTDAGPGLLNVLVAGFPVDAAVAAGLKRRTGGSDFIFRAPGARTVSTMRDDQTNAIVAQSSHASHPRQIEVPGAEFEVLGSPLEDIEGRPFGELLMVRSYEPVRSGIRSLQRQLIVIWGTAIVAAALMSSVFAKRILRPIEQLDRAAARISEQDYSVRVPEGGGDELARLARTFNQMSGSIQEARDELIRQEQLSTIGRLASSIVHDLRNPLAAIYGGAEMMVDGELNPQQTQRVAQSIYRSSRVIKDLLQELVDVSRGRMQAPELCALWEIVGAAIDSQRPLAEQQNVTIEASIDPEFEVLLERGRMERVFLNLVSNALEAMPDGGRISIEAERQDDQVIVRVTDTGPGIPREIRDRLFQPFVTARKTGLGLGLALSRQTVLAHGGDLWVEDRPAGGACFCVSLPMSREAGVFAFPDTTTAQPN
jgi:signal transduction histidine kinase